MVLMSDSQNQLQPSKRPAAAAAVSPTSPSAAFDTVQSMCRRFEAASAQSTSPAAAAAAAPSPEIGAASTQGCGDGAAADVAQKMGKLKRISLQEMKLCQTVVVAVSKIFFLFCHLETACVCFGDLGVPICSQRSNNDIGLGSVLSFNEDCKLYSTLK